jgi:hypothetical protein
MANIKKEIALSKESILAVLQEVYNEIVEQRNTAVRIQNKMLAMMKEPEDMQLIGPIIKEQQKIINDCVEKKLSLSKIQSTLWQKTASQNESFTINDIDESVLQKAINTKTDTEIKSYTIRE